MDVTNYEVTELDAKQTENVNGGIDENGSGVGWALGYSAGWIMNKIDVAVDYYRYNFP